MLPTGRTSRSLLLAYVPTHCSAGPPGTGGRHSVRLTYGLPYMFEGKTLGSVRWLPRTDVSDLK
ncbi:hypothetical protein GCM10010378_58310 [Streptomyces viridochromogenes]